MLADSLSPIPFWTKAVNTACYVQNRVLVTKPHNKTPYELLLGGTPSIGFMRPFACPVTIINTLDPLGKFDGKDDERFLVGYFVRSGPTWLFNIDTLTHFMNYQLVVAGNQPNFSACIQENLNVGTSVKEAASVQQYVLLPLWFSGLKDPQNTYVDTAFDVKEPESAVHASPSSSNKIKKHDEKTKRKAKGKITAVGPNLTNNTNNFNVVGPSDNAVSSTFEIGGKSSFVDPSQYPDDPNMPALEDITYSDDEADVGAEADFSNLETSISVKPIPTTRVHKDHPVTQIIVVRIEAMRLFLAYASFMGFMVYQMEVKSACIYETIEEEVYVCQPSGFKDPAYHDKVYKVVKALHGLHQALRAWYETLANYLLENGFQRGKIDQTLFIKKQKGDILLVQFYVDDNIFRSTNKELYKAFKKLMKYKFKMSSVGELTFFLGLQVNNPIDTKKPLLKDPDVKRIFRYLKGKPHLGLMYPKDSPFNLVAYSDSDYAGASLDMKSTTGGCQFLGCRLISWQCKKKTVVATSSTKAEYVAAASCCAQVLWIQNQLLHYGYNFKHTIIYIGVDTPLFDGMLVQQQVQDVKDDAEDEDEDDDHEVSAKATPPLPTLATTSPPHQQESIHPPPQAETAQPSSPPPQQPS
nr:putative ribonuclease H-like domain-containing protein [Tanacetum cinerariifolium]